MCVYYIVGGTVVSHCQHCDNIYVPVTLRPTPPIHGVSSERISVFQGVYIRSPTELRHAPFITWQLIAMASVKDILWLFSFVVLFTAYGK